jgi:ABC-2 type transport system ATP-binding protein
MIHAHKVSRWFGSGVRKHVAVENLNLDIQSGEVVGLLGPNGAGKTTTIRMITGFIPPSEGSIAISPPQSGGSQAGRHEGFDTIEQSLEARRLIGYLPDASPLYPEMRVANYLDFRGRLYGLDRRTRMAAVSRCLSRCWLNEVKDQRCGTLSKGFRQRVGLASALLHDPPVLVLDEPISGLDPSQIRETRGLIRELADKRTVLVSSHILPEVEKTCTRVVIIVRGRVRADGAPMDLMAREQAASGVKGREVILEAMCSLPGDAERLRAVLGEIRGIRAVQIDSESGGWVRATIRVDGGGARNDAARPEGAVAAHDRDATEVRVAIAAAVARAGLAMRELSVQRASLEQLFLRMMEEDSTSHARDALGTEHAA